MFLIFLNINFYISIFVIIDINHGCWVLGTGYWLLVTGYWLLVTGYWLLITEYRLPLNPSTPQP